MPSDDTREVAWTIARAWEGLACSGGSASGEFLDIGVECGRNDLAVVGGECEGRYPR